MEKTHVTVGDAVSISGLIITPIIRTQVHSWQNKCNGAVFGSIQPLYILISKEKSPIKIFKIDGLETSLESIKEEFPDLQINI